MRHTSPEEFEPDDDRNPFDSWGESFDDSIREFAHDAAPPEPSEKMWTSIQSAISQRCNEEKNRRTRMRFRRNAALLTLAAASLLVGIVALPNDTDRQAAQGSSESRNTSESIPELAPAKQASEVFAEISDRTREPDMITLMQAEDYEIELVRGGEPIWVVGSIEPIPETIALAGVEDLRILNYHPIAVAETHHESAESQHPRETNTVVPVGTSPTTTLVHPGLSMTHGNTTTFAGDKPLFFGDRPPRK